MSPLRVLLDVNVWIANFLARAGGRRGTAVQKIIAAVASGRWGEGGRPVQLVISHDMLDTLVAVLRRIGAATDKAGEYADAIAAIAKAGPEELDPYLLLGGSEQFAMADGEDARVLATAFASRTALLITDNLRDFDSGNTSRIDTRVVARPSGTRQLYAIRHSGPGADLIVAHPLDVIEWLDQRLDVEPDALWARISAAGETGPSTT